MSDISQQDIKFPMNLDVFDLCSDKLQQKLIPMRDKFKALEDKKMEQAQAVRILLLVVDCLFQAI